MFLKKCRRRRKKCRRQRTYGTVFKKLKTTTHLPTTTYYGPPTVHLRFSKSKDCRRRRTYLRLPTYLNPKPTTTYLRLPTYGASSSTLFQARACAAASPCFVNTFRILDQIQPDFLSWLRAAGSSPAGAYKFAIAD